MSKDGLPATRRAIVPRKSARPEPFAPITDFESLDLAANAWVNRELDAWAQPQPHASHLLAGHQGEELAAPTSVALRDGSTESNRRDSIRNAFGKYNTAMYELSYGPKALGAGGGGNILKSAQTNFDLFMLGHCIDWINADSGMSDQFFGRYVEESIKDAHLKKIKQYAESIGEWKNRYPDHPAEYVINSLTQQRFPSLEEILKLQKFIQDSALMDKGADNASKIIARDAMRAALVPQIQALKNAFAEDCHGNIERLEKFQEVMGESMAPKLREATDGLIQVNHWLGDFVVNRLEIATSPKRQGEIIDM